MLACIKKVIFFLTLIFIAPAISHAIPDGTGREIFNSGNVGIGTWAPNQALQVVGTVSATSFIGDGTLVTGVLAYPNGGLNAVQYGDGLSTLGDETKFSFNGTNVGIGTTNGVTKLDVRGNVYASGNIGIGSLNPGTAVDVNGTVRATTFSGDGSALTGINSISGLTSGYVPKATSATQPLVMDLCLTMAM